MPKYTVRDFLDNEAGLNDGEESSGLDGEAEQEQFFINDGDDTSDGPDERPMIQREDRTSAREAEELRVQALEIVRRSGSAYDILRMLPEHVSLGPTPLDPEIWMFRVKAGFEASLIWQIARRSTRQNLEVPSAFARDGIPGYVFIEGTEPAVRAAMKGFVTVLKSHPRMVPLEQRKGLLASRNPLSRPVEPGQWVRCHSGLYRDDIGFVYDIDPSRDVEVTVLFVPRVPVKADNQHTRKRKKGHRPNPRIWSATQIAAEWGTGTKEDSEGRFTFRGNSFRSGLAVKLITSSSLDIVDRAPDLTPFLNAPFLMDHDDFRPWLHRFTQDNIKVDQRIRIESGESQGLIGYTTYIQDDTATIVVQTGTTHSDISILTLLRNLSLCYRPGDVVKHRWSDSTGIVTTVDEQQDSLTFVKDGTNAPITTSTCNVDFFQYDLRFHTMRVGTWVNYTRPGDLTQVLRGRVVDAMDTRATVKDEHSGEESEHNIRDLDVCSTQGRAFLKTNLAHPLVGRRVKISRGELKGYAGIVKDVDDNGVSVEVEARLVSGMANPQIVSWYAIILLLNEKARRSPTPPQARTPSPTTTPARLTPEPEEGVWLLSADIQAVLERRCMPLNVSGVRGGILDEYEGKTVRTMPLAKRKSTPGSDELAVSTVKRGRVKQISINVKFLKPWKPVADGEVVVIEGPSRGTVGTVRAIMEQICTIRSEGPAGASVHYFKPEKVAYLEPFGDS
ncbi:hypothetical protein V8E53_015899 [Lactarius tabidus]